MPKRTSIGIRKSGKLPRLVPPLPNQQRLRTVIVGAGIAGRLVLEELQRHSRLGYVPVGFLDDDLRKQRRKIGGLPVLGRLSQLPQLARRNRIQMALLAIPSAPGSLHRRLAALSRAAGVEFRVVPGVYEVLQRDTAAATIRPASLEDFFRRKPVPFDLEAMRRTLTGKTVLVTGAAGSIGNELCRQLAPFKPKRLVILDHEENNLYDSLLGLQAEYPAVPIEALVGDIRDRGRIRSVLSANKPAVVYHAAAYKHVPIMETNLLEAIKTNILGTAVLIEETARAGVLRFVLISTDKAVNPSSVMGACKRFGELMVVSAASHFSKTAFMVVRFGNVVRSRGNVFERFMQQIAKGGPVTLTHPKMARYFMTREEATQLVMQASAWGKGGETFVLDMGRQIKVVDLARQMVRLAGLRPGVDIRFVWTGLRKGEKLREELLTPQERAKSTRHKRIRVFRSRALSWRGVQSALKAFGRVVKSEQLARGRQLLHRYVPNYRQPRHA